MNQPKVAVTPDTLRKARTEATKLARLLHEEVPDGDVIKDVLYAASLAIKHALPAIRAMAGEAERPNTTGDCTGVG